VGLPEIVDFFQVKEWVPEIKKSKGCFLYDFQSLGVTPEQFVKIFIGRKAILFESPFNERIYGRKCPWCSFVAGKGKSSKLSLTHHLFSHLGKNLLSYQLVGFQKKMYSIKLEFVRKGYHETVAMFVEHSCQDCPKPVVQGREGMCAIPLSARSRMRSLKVLGYPIKHLVNHPKRKYKWSALGVIIPIKTEISDIDI
jgi:hypothetical protein